MQASTSLGSVFGSFDDEMNQVLEMPKCPKAYLVASFLHLEVDAADFWVLEQRTTAKRSLIQN